MRDEFFFPIRKALFHLLDSITSLNRCDVNTSRRPPSSSLQLTFGYLQSIQFRNKENGSVERQPQQQKINRITLLQFVSNAI